jgi:hypothetical protein
MMITPYDVYVAYRKSKISQKNPIILSEQKYRNRLSIKTLWNIDRCSDYFNTIYSNIDINTYMDIGYKIYKNFTYKQILEPKILESYKVYDKRKKRTIKTSNDLIFNSFQFINLPLLNYCKLMNQNQKQILLDYNKGYIDSIIVVYCMYNKIVSFNDIEEQYLYNIINSYNEWVSLMFNYEDYIEKLDKENRIED